ncbi:MAG: recombination mediator RecR [Peptococcaceae bacterium]|nr:recombination mediator RecR [Peptococcaceae bacterium]
MDLFYYPEPLANLISSLARLPGIGPKTAARLSFYMLHNPEDATNLARAVDSALTHIHPCTVCGNYTADDPCAVCAGAKRDRHLICVVEQPRDVVALERTGEYRGLYHVLHGVLSPIDGIGPEQLNIKNLLSRLDGINEVIVAVNPTIEGETTALYLSRLLKDLNIIVTRLARGLPMGADLEYADDITIARALEGRRAMDN